MTRVVHVCVCVQAYERRFPTCDMIPILAHTEKVTEEKSEDGAEHVVERKCSLHVDVPYLLKKVRTPVFESSFAALVISTT